MTQPDPVVRPLTGDHARPPANDSDSLANLDELVDRVAEGGQELVRETQESEEFIAGMRVGIARNYMGIGIVCIFAAVVLIFTISGAIMAYEGKTEGVKLLVGLIKDIGALLTPIMAFVMGYYFANQSKN